MIHRTTYAIAIIASILLLTGCHIPIPVFATPGRLSLNEKVGHYVLQNTNKKGILYFYWEPGLYRVLRGIYISYNGKRIGGLNRGTYFVYEADPGELYVAAENWLYAQKIRAIKVEPGEKYYFRAILGFGARGSDDPRIEMVPDDEGVAAIKKLKYATLE